jgi:hypothetical protein
VGDDDDGRSSKPLSAADGGRRDPPTVPERLPSIPPPEMPRSSTGFLVAVVVIGIVLAFAVLVVIATSMGGSDGRRGDSAEPGVVSSETAQPSENAQSSGPAASASAASTASGSDGGGDFQLEDITHVTVPNVVGMDLQSAQELLFPRLRTTSEDATGQGRRQFVDRNWVVVRMDPPAGTLVPRFTDITLYVVKPGESPQS